VNIKLVLRKIGSTLGLLESDIESVGAGHFSACGADRRAPNSDSTGGLCGRQGPRQIRLFEELKRRNLARVGILYVLGCWLAISLLRVAAVAPNSPGWPDATALLAMAAGFPAVLVLAWLYEITPDGLKRTAEVDRRQSISLRTGQWLDRWIVAVIAATLVCVVVDKFRF
jgi:hypothetical protein